MSSDVESRQNTDLKLSLNGSHTIPVSDGLSICVRSDTKPQNWKIAGLQKGLSLVFKGIETVGEGTGFGYVVPVYSDETCFSATSRVEVEKNLGRYTVRKEFFMDRVHRNKLRNVRLENKRVRKFVGFLSNLYQRNPRMRLLILKNLTKRININAVFVNAEPRGKVTVTYAIEGRRIHVKVDLTQLKREKLQKIFILNEQGSTFFRKYVDSEGAQLTDREIGAWDKITTEWASLIDPRTNVGFRVWTVKNSILRRGREFLEDSLDWVGLDYEVSPKRDVFDYAIEILGE